MYMLISLIGVGTLPTTFTRTLLNWFDRKRGLALGIALSGIGVGGIIIPPVVQHLVGAIGWRETYVVLGMVVLLVAWPAVYWWFRDHPADKGLSIDGVDHCIVPQSEEPLPVPGLGLREAVSTSAFRLIFAGFVMPK